MKLRYRRQTVSLMAFTLVELVVVISIIGIMLTLVGLRLGTFTYWKEESFIRRLSETLVFLHSQAVVDQAYYRIDFRFDTNTYNVGVVQDETDEIAATASVQNTDVGYLSQELALLLSPAIGISHALIPPPSFPSLAEPIALPTDCAFEDVNTMRGPIDAREEDGAYVLFSPRGFSEFAVIHLKMSQGNEVTILVNPFTGLTQIFRERRDFEWTYGKEGSTNRSGS